ncbi:MAG: 23S rRNA (uracil(1939)-C(5))-methyltransferase RlmD [Parachlamydiales bacterium]|jgi:23S rRNA (uracil1939-C5)-methyltransferase
MGQEREKPRCNQNINTTIQSLGFNGEGIGHWHGHRLLIDGALPDEVVRGRVFDCSSRFSRMRLEQIENPSPFRVEPPCRYFGRCGGCQLMHMNLDRQLQFKRERVVNALARFGSFEEIEVAPCAPSPHSLHYRNKILLPVRQGEDGLVLGLYARNSHELVPIRECLVHCPLGEEVFSQVSALVRESLLSAYDHATGEGLLRFLQIRTAETTQQVLVTFVVSRDEKRELVPLAEAIMQRCPAVKGVVMNINSEAGNTALGNIFVTLCGAGSIEEYVLERVFKVSPASFFQVNLHQAEKIYQKAIELAECTAEDILLDAYCGVGTLALCASAKVKKVIGVEQVPEAIEDAKDNCRRNEIGNAEFVCAASEEYITSCGKVDVVIVNPPRKGCAESFLIKLAELRPRSIVYVSCDPATLGRDARILVDRGYTLGTVYPYDMFPQTSHVESVVKLELR